MSVGETERAYAMVHLQRAMNVLSGYSYGAIAGASAVQPFTASDVEAFRSELELALAWLDGKARPRPVVVPLRG